MKTHLESAREVPIVEEADVVVCGGGPAGVAAAMAAARGGARTRLLELHGCLGGIWTAGLLSWIIDARGKRGFIQELYAELERRGMASGRAAHDPKDVETFRDFSCDAEALKLVLEEFCQQAGVRVRLLSRVVAAGVKEGRLDVAVTESNSGREAWRARVFVDATGNGDLAARAGCGFDYGREGTGECQPCSLIAVLGGVRFEEIRPFVGGGWTKDSKKNLLAEMQRAGVEPSYHDPVIFRVHDNLFIMMSNHEYKVSGLNADDVTRATLHARAEVHAQAEALRKLGGPWKDLRLVATGAQIGMRESRRVHGLYRVNVDDLVKGARHEDAVCRVTFNIDVHSPNPDQSKGYDHGAKRAQPYDIPFRALVAKDVKGLMTAGRCISGDFLAHSSYRVTGNAVALGEAAGTGAALAALSGRLPQEVPWAEIAAKLGNRG